MELPSLDRGSQSKIMGLYPDVGNLAAELIDKILQETGLRTRITEGFRTYAYQNTLYAKGRTEAGQIITWARGGQSFHNFGVAFDLCFVGEDPYLAKDRNGSAIWEIAAEAGEEIGLMPGARFAGKKRDLPHFEKTYGLNEKEMDLIVRGFGIKGLWSKIDESLGITDIAWRLQALPDPEI